MCDTCMKPRARTLNVFSIRRNILVSFFILEMERLLFFKNLKIVFTKLYKHKLQRRLPVALCIKWRKC